MKIKLYSKRAIEEKKLTAKELLTETFFCSPNGSIMTIGELSLDQLRTLVFYQEREQRKLDKQLRRAIVILNEIAP